MRRASLLRKDGQPDRRYGNKPRGKRSFDYTWERHQNWLALQRPNPEHVAKLRAGIAEFRSMLEAKGGPAVSQELRDALSTLRKLVGP